MSEPVQIVRFYEVRSFNVFGMNAEERQAHQLLLGELWLNKAAPVVEPLQNWSPNRCIPTGTVFSSHPPLFKCKNCDLFWPCNESVPPCFSFLDWWLNQEDL